MVYDKNIYGYTEHEMFTNSDKREEVRYEIVRKVAMLAGFYAYKRILKVLNSKSSENGYHHIDPIHGRFFDPTQDSKVLDVTVGNEQFSVILEPDREQVFKIKLYGLGEDA